MGITIAGSGTISSSTGSISFDDDNITTTGTIPADQLTGQVPSANLNNAPDLSSDIRALALQSASDRIGLEDGIADPYTDQTDVDSGPTLITTGSNVGDMTNGGGLSSAFDGTTSQAGASSATGANDTGTSFIGKDHGSGNSNTILKYELFAPSDGGFDPDVGGSTITISLRGSDSTPSIGSGTELHTDSFSDATGLTKSYDSGITTSTAYRYHWVQITTNTTNTGQKHGRLAELKLYGTGLSTNQTYDSSGTFYFGGDSEIDRTSGSNIGDMPDHGGLASAFDGTTNQAASASAKKSSATDAYVGKDFGSGNSETVRKAIVTGSNNVGYYSPNDSVTITARLYGGNSTPSNSSDGTLLATATGTDANSLALTMDASSNSTAYRYVWVRVTHDGSADSMYVSELQMFYGQKNITLISNAFAADSAPSSTVIGLQTVEASSCTPNTDFTAEVSRDGGTTFTACTLALKSTLGASGTKYYESASTDISAQPSGTSMKYRIKTLNNKDVQIHGVALKWS